MLTLVLAFSLASDPSQVGKGESPRQILSRLWIPERVLHLLHKDMEPRVKELSRDLWFYHRQKDEYTRPVVLPRGGERLEFLDPIHRKYIQRRMGDFYKNAPYGARNMLGTGLYAAQSPGGLEGEDWGYMVGMEFEKGTRFLDIRGQGEFSQETREALEEIGCRNFNPYFTTNFLFLMMNGGFDRNRCRALALAYLKATEVGFISYDHGALVPQGCVSTSIVVTRQDRFKTVAGWSLRGRSKLPPSFWPLHKELMRFSLDLRFRSGLPSKLKGKGPDWMETNNTKFARKHFFTCGDYEEDSNENWNTEQVSLNLDFPVPQEASCKSPGLLKEVHRSVGPILRALE